MAGGEGVEVGVRSGGRERDEGDESDEGDEREDDVTGKTKSAMIRYG